jgi:hypothetical protein
MTATVDVLTVLRRMSNQAGFARNSTVEFSCEDRLRQSQADRNAVAAVTEMIADMHRIKRAAELGIKYHGAGPGYTEEILATATAAIARLGDAA